MSKNVFKIGDVVYHPEFGRGTVKRCDNTNMAVCVRFDEGREDGLWFSQKVLSFSPWPAPDHKRPIHDGWWIVATNGNPCIREKRKESPHHLWEHGAYTGAAISDYEFIRYLGKDWRAEE